MQMHTAQYMPGMTMAPNQTPLTPEQYAIAQQMAMQNMMHQMYLQYMNYYASVMQASNGHDNNRPVTPMTWPNFFASMQSQNGFRQQMANGQMPNAREVVADQQQPLVQQLNNDDEAENRDWLEILYTFSRLIVLLSLVYFYSSPGRCSIVIFVMVFYYL